MLKIDCGAAARRLMIGALLVVARPMVGPGPAAAGQAGAAGAEKRPAPAEPAPPALALPPAVIDEGLEVTGDSIVAREVRTRLSVPVRVNGRGPFRFVVDSGADRSVIGVGLAERLALPPGPPVTLLSMSGDSRVPTVRVDRLEVGGSAIDDITAPALPEANLGAQGMLGIDALAGQRLMLDFERRLIVVHDARRPAPAKQPGEIVVVARRRRGQLIITQAAAGRHRIQAVIDTGAELSMGNSALRDRVFGGRRPPPGRPVELTSVTGQTIHALLVTMPEITIGGIRLRGVAVAFADVPPFKLFGLERQPALLLGTDVLEAFSRVSLDFGRRRVRFQMRR